MGSEADRQSDRDRRKPFQKESGTKSDHETLKSANLNPFATFSEWSGEADENAYRDL
jgi:hypothetical protein